jgi:predicted membrane protein
MPDSEIPPPCAAARTSAGATAALAVILAVAGVLRFVGLETPSLWWDEIYTPLTARYPASFIFEYCRSFEIQPPYFFFLAKPLMWLGQGDFALRFPYALAGLGLVYLIWRLGLRAFGPAAGLGAAALVAVNPMLLWLSRTLRVYPLLHLGLAASLLLFVNSFADRRRYAEAGLYAVNAVLLLLHYTAVLMVGAEFACLVVWRIFFPFPGGTRAVVRFGIVSLVSFAPAAPFFFSGMVDGGRLAVRSSLPEVAARVAEYLGQDMTYFDLPATRVILAGLVLAGAAACWRRQRRIVLLLAFSGLLPAAAIVAKRYDSHIFPYHLSFMLAPLSVLAGAGLACVPFRAAALAAALFAAAAGVWTMGPARDALYASDSYDKRIFPLGSFKDIARAAPGIIGSSPVLCPDMTHFNATNWYLDQFVAANPLTDQKLGREREATDLVFWLPFDAAGHLAAGHDAFLARYPGIAARPGVETIAVYRLSIPRGRLAVAAGETPAVLGLDAAPEHFYRDVAALSGVMLRPFFGNSVLATRNDVEGWFEYDIDNTAPEQPTDVTVRIRYANVGRDSRVAVDYRLDDGPFAPALASVGPDAVREAVVRLDTASRTWRRLTLRCRLLCAPFTARGGGSNLETVSLGGLDLYICGRDTAGDCQTRLSLDLLPQGFPADRPAGQTVAGQSNVVFQASEERPGWGYYSVVDPTAAGEVRVQLDGGPDGGGLVFYPRVSGRQEAVMVRRSGADNGLRGLPGVWTPLGLAMPVPAGSGREAVFRLEGRFAQLWARDGLPVWVLKP